MKSPEMDSFILPLGESVDLKTIYHSAGPAGMRLMVDGEQAFTTSLSPSSSEAVFPFSPNESGDYSVQLIVEAASLAELRKIRKGKQPEDRVVASASWNITVAEKDNLNQTDIEEFKQHVADATLVYTLISIAHKFYSKWRMLAEAGLALLRSNELQSEENPQSTIDDFHNSESDDDEV